LPRHGQLLRRDFERQDHLLFGLLRRPVLFVAIDPGRNQHCSRRGGEQRPPGPARLDACQETRCKIARRLAASQRPPKVAFEIGHWRTPCLSILFRSTASARWRLLLTVPTGMPRTVAISEGSRSS